MYQNSHPLDCGCDCVVNALLDLRLTSTMSSWLVKKSVSIPGKTAAIFLKSSWQGIDNENQVAIQKPTMRFLAIQKQ